MSRCLEFLYCWASQWDPNGGGIELGCIKGRSIAVTKYKLFKITSPFRRWIDPPSAHMIPINLMLFTQSRTSASIYSPIDIGKVKLYTERRFMVPISDAIPERRDVYKEILEGYISTMVILPEDLFPRFMRPIFEAIEKAEPGWPIDVVLLVVTVKILGKSLVPTTKSVFHSLDNVRLDKLKSSTRQKLCRLCWQRLDQFYDAGEGITRLPCSHRFHVGCFAQCLKLSPPSAHLCFVRSLKMSPPAHVCPICGYKLKLHIVTTPTEPSEPRAWPILLLVASAGSITGVLIGRLLMKRALE